MAAIGWMHRLDLLVFFMPKMLALTNPVAPNRPVVWTEGPDTATTPPDQRPPNIVLILADGECVGVWVWVSVWVWV